MRSRKRHYDGSARAFFLKVLPGRVPSFWIVVALSMVSLSANGAALAQEIKPPFSLHWGESSEHLEKLLKDARARIVEKRYVEGRTAWTVEGLVQSSLRRTLFYFKTDQLVE